MQINEHFCAKYKQNLHISKKSAKKFARACICEIKVVLLHPKLGSMAFCERRSAQNNKEKQYKIK